MDDTGKNSYEDIIDLPYPFPTSRPRMSMYDRAAQFGSFAALTGHEEAIEEKARFTSTWVEPDETVKEELNRKLQIIMHDSGSYSFTYFVPDERKAGGSYETGKGQVKNIDSIRRIIHMLDGTNIPIDYIAEIEQLR